MNLRRLLPRWVKRPIRFIMTSIMFFPYRGKGRHCPVCGRNARAFGVFGIDRRKDARCMWCGALERHRLVWLFFTKRTNLFDAAPKRMLHFGPEPFFIHRFGTILGDGYVSADLFNPDARVKMDITDIRFPDSSFDVIYCSHVLEHVDDDRKAMRELRRVLRPDGWAVILVPMSGYNTTIEDPTITDPKERLARFHQEDHVRLYGFDYVDRLREAGFQVDVIPPADFLGNQEIVEMGITPAAGSIYFCRPENV